MNKNTVANYRRAAFSDTCLFSPDTSANICYLCGTTGRVIVFLQWNKESPDSKEQYSS